MEKKEYIEPEIEIIEINAENPVMQYSLPMIKPGNPMFGG